MSSGISQSQTPARPRPLPTPDTNARRGDAVNNGPQTCVRSEASSSGASSSSPPPTTMQATQDEGLGQSMLGLSLQASPPRRERRLSSAPPASSQNDVPALVEPLPTISSLQEEGAMLRVPRSDPRREVKWIRDVLFLVNRACISPSAAVSSDPQVGPLIVEDSRLLMLANSAIKLLLTLCPDAPPVGTKLDRHIAEALYIRATLLQSGAFPEDLPENPRKAFRAFEASARAGYHASWFKLGRCYEAFDDFRRAKDCFERGVKYDDVSCLYRMGMAYLMGQLGLEISTTNAVPLLFRAAERATVTAPQPAYVYGSLLLGDFAHTSAVLPPSVFFPYIPTGSTIEQEAQRFIERAAYLHFTPAQYKLGYYYEFARSPYAYDPLLSVQYYTLASDAEPEACLALSKWFLCGAEGVFKKDEALARTFAERAARVGLPSAEFAMGYYWEVGIGSRKDMTKARKWYEKASAHGNADAADRLASLAQDEAKALSRQDHDMLAEQTLVRRRTQAKQRSDAAGSVRRSGPREDADQVVELVRKASKIQPRGRKGRGAISGVNWAEAPLPSAGPPKRESNGNGLAGIEENPQWRERGASSGSALAPPSQLLEKKRYSLVDASANADVNPGMMDRGRKKSNGNTLPVGEPEESPQPLPQWRDRESTAGSGSSRLTLPQFPEKKRYSLVDPGPSSRAPSCLPQPQFGDNRFGDVTQTPPRRYASPSPSQANTSRTGSEVGSSALSSVFSDTPPGLDTSASAPSESTRNAENAESAPRRVKYNTFAEMGIQGTKLEEKDCIIM